MIARDNRNLAAQLPGLMAMQKVGQTVKLTRNQNRHFRLHRRLLDPPPHAEAFAAAHALSSLCQTVNEYRVVNRPSGAILKIVPKPFAPPSAVAP
jgi:hypothetical protein